MKINTLTKILIVFTLFGVIIPSVTAKPKTDYIKAIGKGTVTTADGRTVNGVVTLYAKFTPGSYSEGGTGYMRLRFNRPNGKKMSVVSPFTCNLIVDDKGVLQGLHFETAGWPDDYPLERIKNKVYGNLETEIMVNGELVKLDFYLRFQIEIEGLTAEI